MKFTVNSGHLPAGINLNADTGVIDGTPTESGTFLIVIVADDGNGNIGSQGYEIVIQPPATGGGLVISPSFLPGGNVGIPYGPVKLTAVPK